MKLSQKLIITAVSILSVLMNAAAQTPQNWQSLIESGNQEATQVQSMMQSSQEQDQVAEGAILFVSLGMPKLLLQQYLRQSQIYHVPLVVRGLLKNSYPETAKTLYGILHPENQAPLPGGVEIDPIWFKQFGITAVPALVVSTPEGFSVVYGNIPISLGLHFIAQKSLNSSVVSRAEQVLKEATYAQ